MKNELKFLRREITCGLEFFIYMYADSHNYRFIANYMIVCLVLGVLVSIIDSCKEDKK